MVLPLVAALPAGLAATAPVFPAVAAAATGAGLTAGTSALPAVLKGLSGLASSGVGGQQGAGVQQQGPQFARPSLTAGALEARRRQTQETDALARQAAAALLGLSGPSPYGRSFT